MPLIKADRVKETTTTTGTGSFTLAGPVAGYRAFSSVMATGDFCYYTAINPATNEWECGVGTFTAPSTLARSSVESSSNNGNAVNFGSGIKEVFLSVTAGQFKCGTYPSYHSELPSVYLGHNVNKNGTALASNFAENVMIGNQSFLNSGISGSLCSRNIGIGIRTLSDITSDSNYGGAVGQVAIGYYAGAAFKAGAANTLIGNLAGRYLVDGSNNIVICASIVSRLTAESNNVIAIGSGVDAPANNTIVIGSYQTDCYIAGHLHPSGAIRPASIADASAPTNAIYYSTTAGKLVYKDASGTVNNLY